MKGDLSINHRKSIRLQEYDYSKEGMYFVTLCTQNRVHFFGEIIEDEMILNDAGRMVEQWYCELENKFNDIACNAIIIMPNHIHFIVKNVGTEHIGSPLYRVVQWFKTMTTNQYIHGVKNNQWQKFDGKLWQRNYWEHIIRNENEYHEIVQYIIDNPKKWALDNLNNGKQIQP